MRITSAHSQANGQGSGERIAAEYAPYRPPRPNQVYAVGKDPGSARSAGGRLNGLQSLPRFIAPGHRREGALLAGVHIVKGSGLVVPDE